MGLTVLQVNIKNFKKYKYTLQVDLCNHQPDILLVNETGIADPLQMKIKGYRGTWLRTHAYDGMAIFFKYDLEVEYLRFKMEDLLAIKVKTSFGPVIISTTYSPPRDSSLPLISLNQLFSHKFPVLFMGDINAHHSVLGNITNRRSPDVKGKQINHLINKFNLTVLGPHFDTFSTSHRTGQPDVILANNSFSLFNHRIYPGGNIGSDHIPVMINFRLLLFKLSAQLPTI